MVAEGKCNEESPPEQGAKNDSGKAPIYRGLICYFPRAVEAVSQASAWGAREHSWKGWETLPDGINRLSDALVRHLTKEGKGEVLDSDSGLLHATSVAWNSLARLELILREREKKEGK